jgi:hypothetical protein
MRWNEAKTLPPRAGAELALLAAVGLFMGALGPYGTATMPAGLRYPYWLICIVGGGAIGITLDLTVGRRITGLWRRVAVSSALMTPGVTLLVIAAAWLVAGGSTHLPPVFILGWEVLLISAAIMAVRALIWRERPRVVETRTVVVPPLPEAEAAFRRRLSAKRRTARLIAVEAYDHYLRVHTDAGPELVTLRFADALDELSAVHGFRVHRSWWVAADAIEAVRWRRGGGEAQLACDVSAPISRSHAPALKAAGWF